STGVKFSGLLHASYGPFQYDAQVSGSVSINYAEGTFSLNVSQMSIPITVLLPFPFNSWTITTLSVSPNYNAVYPIGALLVNVAANGGMQGIQVAPATVAISYQPGAIIVKMGYVAW